MSKRIPPHLWHRSFFLLALASFLAIAILAGDLLTLAGVLWTLALPLLTMIHTRGPVCDYVITNHTRGPVCDHVKSIKITKLID
jgi:hypothetical protein